MSSYLPDGEITVKEYNEEYNREREHAASFLHNLEHAVQKGGAHEETMRQLSIIGWSEVRKTLQAALSIYHQVLKGKLVGGHPSSEFRHVVLCKDCEYGERCSIREAGGFGESGYCGKGVRKVKNPCGHCFSGSYRGCDGCSYGEQKED